MKPGVSRRDALRQFGAGVFLLSHPSLISACIEQGAADSELPALSVDPDQPYWMQNNFAPVLEERDVFDLEVVGEIPASLSGTFLRNGPNPKHGSRGHFFTGDGMLHGVRLRAGRAEWYRNRWIQTPILDRDRSIPLNPQANLTDVTANVSVLRHAGRLLALGEAGLPFEVTTDLSTIGPFDFAGKLKTFMTAHPKIDPLSGELHMYGYSAAKPHFTYHLVSAAGELVRSVPITLPAAAIVHDIQITRNWVVLFDLPVRVDVKRALAGDSLPARWQPEHGARIGLLPRAGSDADVIWFEIEPCYIFHAFNAYEDASGKVVLDACRFARLWEQSPDVFDYPPLPHRYVLDPIARSAQLSQIDDHAVDFPQIDPRRVGLEHRYAYGLNFALDRTQTSNGPQLLAFGGHDLIKYDRLKQSSVSYSFGPARFTGEGVFVPAGPSADEDDGFLMAFVFDRREQRSSLEIFRAQALERGPIASVRLPVRIPYGIHGNWIPS